MRKGPAETLVSPLLARVSADSIFRVAGSASWSKPSCLARASCLVEAKKFMWKKRELMTGSRGRRTMKALNGLAVFLAAIFLIPAFALARDNNNNQHSITLSEPVEAGNVQLNSGSYKLEWKGTGPQVQVLFLQHGKDVATLPATVKTHDQRITQDDVLTHKTASNLRKLDEIDFAKGKDALVFTHRGA
jgi:hypothetical protein